MNNFLKPSVQITLAVSLGLALTSGTSALAQSSAPQGSRSLSQLEAGYGNGRAMESRSFDHSTRDANGNRLIVNGLIRPDQSGYASQSGLGLSYGADFYPSGMTSNSATAIGNLTTVTIDGSWNTVIVNSIQTNTGSVTARAGGGDGPED